MANQFDVVFWEEPILVQGPQIPDLLEQLVADGAVTVVTPRLPERMSLEQQQVAQSILLQEWADGQSGAVVRWYYTPMMLTFSRELKAVCTVYDCMDELANFRFAPERIKRLEWELLALADVVFTGGHSLYEAKRELHSDIHAFPSSVDRAHFARARANPPEPADQAMLPKPRLGFFGVVDERLDLDLLARLADAHPEWSLVIVGPVVKIDLAILPQWPNIHFLGMKSYQELPGYLGGWDVALMPFALNESTRFISPTKTPEYLAGGRPVVSTAITDVARQYGELEGVLIAETQEDFVTACETALRLDPRWLSQADAALAGLSWDKTHDEMSRLVQAAIARRAGKKTKASPFSAWSGKRRKPRYDVMVVGAGFAGSVLADRFAAGLDKRVLVIDKRPHIGGNAHDRLDDAGIRIHPYGPHIFHTNSAEVFGYLSRFTRWRPYEHRVLAHVEQGLVPMPINRTTLNKLYGLQLANDEAAATYLAGVAESCDRVRTAEDAVVSQVGRELYETFFRGYTRKQWGLDPAQLDKSVTARVPARHNEDDRYFTDRFQFMPADGYAMLFDNLLDHANIDVLTEMEFADARAEFDYDSLVYTGPIDEYFGYRYGELPYRSLRFQHETVDHEWFQPVGTVNFPAEWTPYTRITEFKHLTGQRHRATSIAYEYPTDEGPPYYPVPREENQAIYKQYQVLAGRTPDVYFAGRLATYRYYNMDQVVGQALATYRRLAEITAVTSQTGQFTDAAAAT